MVIDQRGPIANSDVGACRSGPSRSRRGGRGGRVRRAWLLQRQPERHRAARRYAFIADIGSLRVRSYIEDLIRRLHPTRPFFEFLTGLLDAWVAYFAEHLHERAVVRKCARELPIALAWRSTHGLASRRVESWWRSSSPLPDTHTGVSKLRVGDGAARRQASSVRPPRACASSCRTCYGHVPDRILPSGVVRQTAPRHQRGTYVGIPRSDHMVFSGVALPVTMGHIDDWIATNHVLSSV